MQRPLYKDDKPIAAEHCWGRHRHPLTVCQRPEGSVVFFTGLYFRYSRTLFGKEVRTLTAGLVLWLNAVMQGLAWKPPVPVFRGIKPRSSDIVAKVPDPETEDSFFEVEAIEYGEEPDDFLDEESW